ncbi:MAG TPA: rhodanese-like domain-containing protein [Casimicrobiaceae bacterium]|nr:rhodanese-like domain-containing protein [Casimicrobiaceae bacterium]
MTRSIDASALRSWLADGGELAVLDVREPGQYDRGHLLASVPLPYSRLELDVPALVPNPAVRLALCDQGDGVAWRAARRLQRLGYDNVHVLDGPPSRWAQCGWGLFEGVNTLSKAFGERVEHACRTPHLTAPELKQRIDRGDDVLVIDGRPLAEYRKMNIPGSLCCPNGELALRIAALAPDPNTTIVVNCAGRTRSIIGAQTLRSLGVRNPVFALEDGTQGWFLAGFALEHGASRTYSEEPSDDRSLETFRARTSALMLGNGVPTVDATTVNAWRADRQRTTYVFDVTNEATFAHARLGIVHAPGGQLLQATDRWIGVRGARSVLVDGDGVRAGVVASWLRQMGHRAAVLQPRAETGLLPVDVPRADLPVLASIGAGDVAGARLIDLRTSEEYRAGHAAGAVWSVRPRIVADVANAQRVALISTDAHIACLAAIDLIEAGVEVLGIVANASCTEVSPGIPSPEDAIDVLTFAQGRHEGNRAAAIQYLDWEKGLLDRLTAEERALLVPVAGEEACA